MVRVGVEERDGENRSLSSYKLRHAITGAASMGAWPSSANHEAREPRPAQHGGGRPADGLPPAHDAAMDRGPLPDQFRPPALDGAAANGATAVPDASAHAMPSPVNGST